LACHGRPPSIAGIRGGQGGREEADKTRWVPVIQMRQCPQACQESRVAEVAGRGRRTLGTALPSPPAPKSLVGTVTAPECGAGIEVAGPHL
jgi:hypothetical protein